MPNPKIVPVKAFTDNYIWCIRKDDTCVVVDPGDAVPVLNYCKQHGLSLSDILITHHHWDHTNGLPDLLAAFPHVKVHGPHNPRITAINNHLAEGDKVYLASVDLEFKVLEVPGHTLDHIAYYHEQALFCGDTLFSVGCGRLFEGTPVQMYDSLQKLSQLPGDTPVYCTHEYTLANISFAIAVEAQNEDLIAYKGWAESQRLALKSTLPSTISQQLAINPFLRVAYASVKASVQAQENQSLHADTDYFAALRRWKDNF